MIEPITELNISLNEIDTSQEIDETRRWSPILTDLDETEYDNAVFVGFRAGDSPPMADEIEYDDPFTETLWVYKTDFTVRDLVDGEITPQELFKELAEEQPNIEIVGLCKYDRDIPPKEI